MTDQELLAEADKLEALLNARNERLKIIEKWPKEKREKRFGKMNNFTNMHFLQHQADIDNQLYDRKLTGVKWT